MRIQLSYQKIAHSLFTVWVALHTLNYSVDIDAVLVSQANYNPQYLIEQEDKIESFVEFFARIIFEDNFDDFEDNPFSHNEQKSFSPIVCLVYPSIPQVIDDVIELKTKTDQQHFYLGRNYPTPIKSIVPPPPRRMC